MTFISESENCFMKFIYNFCELVTLKGVFTNL